MSPTSPFPAAGTPSFPGSVPAFPDPSAARGPILPPIGGSAPDLSALGLSTPADSFNPMQGNNGPAPMQAANTTPPGSSGREAGPSQAELAALMQLLGGMGGPGGPGGLPPGLLQGKGIGGHNAVSNMSMQPDGSVWENNPSSASLPGSKGLLGVLGIAAAALGAIFFTKRIFASKAAKELSTDAIKAAEEYIGQHDQRVDAFKDAIQTKDTGKAADLKQKAAAALDRFLKSNTEKVIADRPKLDAQDAVQVAHDEFYGLTDVLNADSNVTALQSQATERAELLKTKLDHYFETVVR